MKAMILTRYGGPGALQMADIEPPVPDAGEALIEVKASSINSWDYELVMGTPIYNRMMAGLFEPKKNRLGFDVAGTVTAVGEGVTTLTVGDRVFGDLSEGGWGAYAEFAVAAEGALARMPAGMSFDQAAALPQAGILALQGVRLAGEIRPGMRAVINGAGGGVGTLAIPMLKKAGAEVTAVDVAEKLPKLEDLGADHVIDYRETDFTANGEKYDLILDPVANRSIFAYRRALAPGGKFGVIGGKTGRLLEYALLNKPLTAVTGKTFSYVWHEPTTPNTERLAQLFCDGTITPVIDRTFPLDQTVEAFRYFAENRFVGKIVITV